MSDEDPKLSELPPLSSWKPENLRLTLFSKEEAIEQTWWMDLFGVLADKIDSQPKKLLHLEEGLFEEGKLVLSIQPGRIDWRYIIDIEEELKTDGEMPFTLGELPTAVDKFLEFILKWFELQSCPSATRLAFGAVLLQLEENPQAGYRKIAEYLPDVRLPLDYGMSDFTYRVNIPCESKTDLSGLKINRLRTWSVAGFGTQMALPIGTGVIQDLRSPIQFACRLELDINTVPQYQAGFTRDQLPKVFNELVELGKEIAQKGNIL